MKRFNLEEIQRKLKNCSVGIAGAGGLGSNCAVALARVGIGQIVIADFDVVDESNLNRQYYFLNQIGEKKVVALKHNIKKINSQVFIEAHDIKLTPNSILDIYKSCDIIVEAFDRADQKQMLIETVLGDFPEKPLVIGIGMAGFGESNLIEMKQQENLYICGDQINEVAEDLPPLAPRVGIVANMQANTVLDILLNS